MRRGVAADFPHKQGRGRGQIAPRPNAQVALSGPARSSQSAHTNSAHAKSAHANTNPAHINSASDYETRANIARLFVDLRNAMRLSPHQAAGQLQTAVETIQALETGHFEGLPPWPETSRVVMAFGAMAGIDGRPVLAALANVLAAQVPVSKPVPVHVSMPDPMVISGPPAAAPHAGHNLQVERLRQAGAAIANGAKRLPAGAIKQVRERPERAFYAVSLPLAIVLLLLNTSVLQAAFNHVPRPVSRMTESVRQFFQVQFAPVREGLRWIEVDEPRRRRGDKLRTGQ